jgi:hypothetical protein
MGRILGGRAAGILAAVIGSLVAAAGVEAAPYKVAEFFGLDRYAGLNDRGLVFGSRDFESPPQAFVFDSLGGGRYTMVDRPSAVGDFSGSVNDVLLIPMTSGSSVLYDVSTGESAIPDASSLGGFRIDARDDSGRLYGIRYDYESSPSAHRPFVVEGGTGRDLNPPPGVTNMSLTAVNAGGDVLVQADSGAARGDKPEAYILRGDAWTHLGTFQAVAFNDKGEVLGYVMPRQDGGAVSPILVPADGSGPVALEGLLGAPGIFPVAINNRGEIVGHAASDALGGINPFIYREGVATDLNTLIERTGKYGELTVHFVSSINELGQILASGTDNGHWVTLLLSPSELAAVEGEFRVPPPVPEPSALLVFAGLAVGAGLVRRGRRG